MAGGGPGRGCRARRARSVPRVPRLQERMPGERGRGPLQERVPGALLGRARHPAEGAGVRLRGRDRGLGQPLRADREPPRGQHDGPAPGRSDGRARPAAHAAAVGRDARCDAGWHRASGLGPTARPCSSRTPSPRTSSRRLAWPRSRCWRPAGLGATLAPHVCCGRPLISQGLLSEARDRAARNVARTLPPRRAGRADRVRRAELPVGGARGRAGSAERIAPREGARGRRARGAVRGVPRGGARRRPRGAAPAGRARATILLHVHCHQRSMGLGASAAALLRRIPGADGHRSRCRLLRHGGIVRLHLPITTTCRRPSASGSSCRPRAALAAGAVLAAAGTSCRHQVQHFTGVQATHPAVLIHASMEKAPA